MIFLTNNDKPGVIGNIGTILGAAKVNIAGMHLGREVKGGMALALLLIDNAVGEDILKQVRNTENVLSARAVLI